MNHLLRSLAPISDAGWQLLDDEARQRVLPALAARKVVDFSGPHGWSHSATNLGRTSALSSAPGEGVTGLQRRVLPLVEARADFDVSLDELRAGDRGAADVNLDELDRAAHRIALAENAAVFHGWAGAIAGITQSSPHDPIALGDYPSAVAAAVETLSGSGIAGPYALVLAPQEHQRVIESSEHGGYPLLEHLARILGGPLIRAAGVQGAVLVSQRGGDFLFDCGQDLAIGYDSHDGRRVHLYLQESFSFQAATPDAAVALIRRAARNRTARPAKARPARP